MSAGAVVLLAWFGGAGSSLAADPPLAKPYPAPIVEQLVTLAVEKGQGLKNKRLAVSEFNWIDGGECGAGKMLCDQLISGLATSGKITVVDRTKLDKVLEEQKLELSGLVDQAEAKEAGKLLSVDGLVVGTIARLEKSHEIHARVVDVESGEILGAANVSVPDMDAEEDDEVRTLKKDQPEEYRAMMARRAEMAAQLREHPKEFDGAHLVRQRVVRLLLTDPRAFLEASGQAETMERLQRADPFLARRVAEAREHVAHLQKEEPKKFLLWEDRGRRLAQHPRKLRLAMETAMRRAALGQPLGPQEEMRRPDRRPRREPRRPQPFRGDRRGP